MDEQAHHQPHSLLFCVIFSLICLWMALAFYFSCLLPQMVAGEATFADLSLVTRIGSTVLLTLLGLQPWLVGRRLGMMRPSGVCQVLRSVLSDLRVVSAALSALLIPIDMSHGQIPWHYNSFCDWTTTTLLSVACGQTLAVCVARQHAVRWWVVFIALLSLHLTDLLYGLLLSVTMLIGGSFFPGLMGRTSRILGLLFIITSAVFIICHYVFVSAVRPKLPVWERLLRTFLGLASSFASLLLCISFAPDDTLLQGGADTVLYIGARALIPYCFWSFIQYPSRTLSTYFSHASSAPIAIEHNANNVRCEMSAQRNLWRMRATFWCALGQSVLLNALFIALFAVQHSTALVRRIGPTCGGVLLVSDLISLGYSVWYLRCDRVGGIFGLALSLMLLAIGFPQPMP